MTKGEARRAAFRAALRETWQTMRLLGPLMFGCVTLSVYAAVVWVGDPGSAAKVVEEATGDGVSGTDAPGVDGPIWSGAEFATAALLGTLAALVTAVGTAAAKVIRALAELRLSEARASAIRRGRPPLGPADGT